MFDFDEVDERLKERFKKFHKENPQVWQAFKKKAIEIKATGRIKYSHITLFEIIRWEHDIKTRGETFKINNDFRSIYVRWFINSHPEFEGFFETRQMKSVNRQYSEEDQRRLDESEK